MCVCVTYMVSGRICKTWNRHTPDFSKCDSVVEVEESQGLAGLQELPSWN